MTIPRRAALRVRISTFLSSAPVCPESERPAISFGSGRGRRSRSSKRVTRSGAPGIFFAIRAFARTRICRLSATRSVHGTIRQRSPTAPRSCAISPKRRKPMASIATFVSASRSCGRRGGPRTLAGRSTLTVQTARSSSSPATFSSCARATTNMRKATRPGWPGMERFAGRIVHPQKWPEDLHYDGKRVVVIGSGATAVTIVPAMAAKAAHVVMLQRSPTYVVARPAEEAIAKRLKTMAADAGRARRRALEEHPLADVPLSAFAAQTGRDAGANPQACAGGAWPRVQRR